MEFRKKDALRKSRIFILENVIFDVLVDHLIDQDIFADGMLDNMKAGGDSVEKIRRMLDFLSRRMDCCYERFLVALKNSGHPHCADFIHHQYVMSGHTQVSDPSRNRSPVSAPTTPVGSGFGLSSIPYHIPMESSISNFTENWVAPNAPESMQVGLPELSTSMQANAGTFIGYSTQVSSASQLTHETEHNHGYLNEEEAGIMECAPVSTPVSNTLSYQQQIVSNPDGVYQMESTPRGLALVINIENFESMSARRGSKRDMENLDAVFKTLGFHLNHQVDKTKKEILQILNSFAKFERLGQVDSMIVIILSHGGRQGVIFGSDGSNNNGQARNYVTDEQISDIFSARNCPQMAHKPKLIIIQACRGGNEDGAAGTQPGGQIPPAVRNSSKNKPGLGLDGPNSSHSESAASTAMSERTANMADICLIHSTVQGYVSYRHPVEGSPFIQQLSRTFLDRAGSEHLIDMMTQVNRKLASRQLMEDRRTVASTTNTLTRKWYLNPLNAVT